MTNHRRHYTADDRHQIHTLTLLGVSTAEQARRLGRTARAVRDYQKLIGVVRPPRLCSLPTCERRQRRNGLCDSHSKKVKQIGVRV